MVDPGKGLGHRGVQLVGTVLECSWSAGGLGGDVEVKGGFRV